MAINCLDKFLTAAPFRCLQRPERGVALLQRSFQQLRGARVEKVAPQAGIAQVGALLGCAFESHRRLFPRAAGIKRFQSRRLGRGLLRFDFRVDGRESAFATIVDSRTLRMIDFCTRSGRLTGMKRLVE